MVTDVSWEPCRAPEYGIARLQMENQFVPGDGQRYVAYSTGKMNPDRDDSQLPDDAAWSDDGTDPKADANWIAAFSHTSRHYRFYDTYDHRFPTWHPDNRILFGVVLIETENIEESNGGILFPSPSMIGHLDSLPPKTTDRDPNAPLATYSQTGGSNDAFRFDSDVGFRINGINIQQDKIRWLSVRPLDPIVRCIHCNGILASPKAKQCLHCGKDWH